MHNKIWLAPAKLNLFLHITGVREDGYHNLQTIFQLLDYCDELSFDLRDDKFWFREYAIDEIDEENDLILKSIKALLAYCFVHQLLDNDFNYGLNIHLRKKIPMGGGLGGGSSDAATTLIALNQLWNLNLDKQTLMSIGQNIGADVPIFIFGENAWAEGIGEDLHKIKLKPQWYLIISPSIHVSTQTLFKEEKLNRCSTYIQFSDYSKKNGLGEFDVKDILNDHTSLNNKLNHVILDETNNVFEEIVLDKYPPIKEAASWLSQFGTVRLTGTGACVFCAMASQQECEEVLSQLPNEMNGFYAKGEQVSPLLK